VSRVAQPLQAVAASAVAVAAATGLIFGLRPVAPVLSLGVLYLLAVLPVAVVWGLPYAIAVSVASMLALNWFFLPPRHTLALRDSENWVVLGVYLVTGVVVSGLAAASRRRAAEAEQREREAALLADVSIALLENEHVQGELREIAARVGAVLGADRPSIELDSRRRPEPHESAHDLVAGGRHVGRLFADATAPPEARAAGRLLPALASVLAVAGERERLGRKALEAEALRRSDAIKTAILRAVSHDLRSPLTAIMASVDGLESASLELSDADRRDLLAAIREEAKRLDRLVGNLLDLSRLEVGSAAPRRELWTLDALVGRAVEQLGADAERVSVSLPADPPAVRADGTQIERALANLLDNALKFSADERVELVVDERDGEALARVSDRGPGLRPRDLERIFDPFERGEASSGRGTGLGLAIARGFVQANGGRLWAEPREGGGTTFVLALPLAPLPARVHA
jgi:two-component system, OmpR family, sensor histidine kinase KdpD